MKRFAMLALMASLLLVSCGSKSDCNDPTRCVTITSAETSGRDVNIPRETLLAALYATKDHVGLSGVITCSSLGDCATPNIAIYQVRGLEFIPIYP